MQCLFHIYPIKNTREDEIRRFPCHKCVISQAVIETRFVTSYKIVSDTRSTFESIICSSPFVSQTSLQKRLFILLWKFVMLKDSTVFVITVVDCILFHSSWASDIIIIVNQLTSYVDCYWCWHQGNTDGAEVVILDQYFTLS